MSPAERVIAKAEAHGWEAKWMHKLLILKKHVEPDTWHIAQVLFRNGRWWYAAVYHRLGAFWPPTFESESTLLKRRRDLFTYLEAPQ